MSYTGRNRAFNARTGRQLLALGRTKADRIIFNHLGGASPDSVSLREPGSAVTSVALGVPDPAAAGPSPLMSAPLGGVDFGNGIETVVALEQTVGNVTFGSEARTTPAFINSNTDFDQVGLNYEAGVHFLVGKLKPGGASGNWLKTDKAFYELFLPSGIDTPPPDPVSGREGGRPLLVICHDSIEGFGTAFDECPLRSLAVQAGWGVLACQGILTDTFSSIHQQREIEAILLNVLAAGTFDRRRIHMIGLGTGASLAVIFAARHQDYQRIFCASVTCVAGELDMHQRWNSLAAAGSELLLTDKAQMQRFDQFEAAGIVAPGAFVPSLAMSKWLNGTGLFLDPQTYTAPSKVTGSQFNGQCVCSTLAPNTPIRVYYDTTQPGFSPANQHLRFQDALNTAAALDGAFTSHPDFTAFVFSGRSNPHSWNLLTASEYLDLFAWMERKVANERATSVVLRGTFGPSTIFDYALGSGKRSLHSLEDIVGGADTMSLTAVRYRDQGSGLAHIQFFQTNNLTSLAINAQLTPSAGKMFTAVAPLRVAFDSGDNFQLTLYNLPKPVTNVGGGVAFAIDVAGYPTPNVQLTNVGAQTALIEGA